MSSRDGKEIFSGELPKKGKRFTIPENDESKKMKG